MTDHVGVWERLRIARFAGLMVYACVFSLGINVAEREWAKAAATLIAGFLFFALSRDDSYQERIPESQ